MALWTPADLATDPKYWFDISDSATVSKNGSNEIDTVTNKGTGTLTATQSTASRKPLWVSAGIGGLDVMHIDALGVSMDWSGTWGLNALTRLRAGGSNSSWRAVIDGSNRTTTSATYALENDFLMSIIVDAATGWEFRDFDIIGDQNTTTGISGGAASIFAVGKSNGDNGAGYFNTLIDSTGFGNTNAYNQGFNGYIGEVVCLDYEPSAGERQYIEGYLAWKWGLEGSLDAGHPYKSAAPTTGGGYTLTAETGVFTLAGQAAGLAAARRLTAASGAFALTGQAAGLKSGRKIAAAAGAFALSGQAAGLRAARRLSSAAGAFALTGQAATLIYTSGPAVLTAAAGAYVVTGAEVTFRIGGRTWTRIDPNPGAWSPQAGAASVWTPEIINPETWTRQ